MIKNKKPRVVIDTQIFMYSWFGNTYFYSDAIMDLVENDKLQIIFSQETIGELLKITKNFAIRYIDEPEQQLSFMYAVAGMFFEYPSANTKDTICPKLIDNNDEMFLKCAIEGNAEYIITNDKKHGMHDNEEIEKLGIKVVTSEEFIPIYEGKHRDS